MSAHSPICRICLSNDELQVSIFGGYARRHRILVKIRVCLPITVEENDIHSKTICYNCISLLDRYYDYYCNSLTTQRVLENGDSSYREYFRKKVDRRFTAAVSHQSRQEEIKSAVPAIMERSNSSRHSDRVQAVDLLTQSPSSPHFKVISSTTYVVDSDSPQGPIPSTSFLDLRKGYKKKKKETVSRRLFSTYDAGLPRVSPVLFDGNVSIIQ